MASAEITVQIYANYEGLEWKAKPTLEGQYWAFDGARVDMVEVYESMGVLDVYGHLGIASYVLWLGPLPPPRLPRL